MRLPFLPRFLFFLKQLQLRSFQKSSLHSVQQAHFRTALFLAEPTS
jgi:hypothetical protein